MVRSETVERVSTATAILVTLPEPIEKVCADILLDSGLRVLKVKNVAAAAERIAANMPHLVLVPNTMHQMDLDTIISRCTTVGAELQQVLTTGDPQALATAVREAGAIALTYALRRGF
jgi:DNA-binding NtrC family response regulator